MNSSLSRPQNKEIPLRNPQDEHGRPKREYRIEYLN